MPSALQNKKNIFNLKNTICFILKVTFPIQLNISMWNFISKMICLIIEILLYGLTNYIRDKKYIENQTKSFLKKWNHFVRTQITGLD